MLRALVCVCGTVIRIVAFAAFSFLVGYYSVLYFGVFVIVYSAVIIDFIMIVVDFFVFFKLELATGISVLIFHWK